MKNKALIIAVIVLCIETFLLTMYNVHLKKEVNKYQSLFYKLKKEETQGGNVQGRNFSEFPNVIIESLQGGEKTSISKLFDSSKTLVCYFSIDCIVCEKMAAHWNAIYNEYQNNTEVKIIGISQNTLDDIEFFIARNDIRFPVFTISEFERESDKEFFFDSPKSVMVDSDGAIRSIYQGYDTKLNQIKKLLWR